MKNIAVIAADYEQFKYWVKNFIAGSHIKDYIFKLPGQLIIDETIYEYIGQDRDLYGKIFDDVLYVGEYWENEVYKKDMGKHLIESRLRRNR